MSLTTASSRLADSEAADHVRRFQAGDRSAFGPLYLGYFNAVFAYLKLSLRDPHEAEDAAQQVFLAAYSALDAYEDRGKPFRAWLFTIARHQALATRRAVQRRPTSEDPVTLERKTDRATGPYLASLVDDGSDAALRRLVEGLPQSQRQVLFLRFAFDCQHDEIAEITGRSPDAVRQLMTRAMKTLRARLAPMRAETDAEELILQAA